MLFQSAASENGELMVMSKRMDKSITSRTDHYELREDIYNFGNTTLSGSDLSKRSDSDANNSFVWSDIS